MFLSRNLWVIAMTLIVNVTSHAVSRDEEPESTDSYYLAQADGGRQNDRQDDTIVLRAGEALFQRNCSVCHGLNAEGVSNWQVRDADGQYPPPPLNGTAHTWHHPTSLLLRTIKEGTGELGGSMPAWEGKLGDDEILAIIQWITSLWPDEIYQAWIDRGGKD